MAAPSYDFLLKASDSDNIKDYPPIARIAAAVSSVSETVLSLLY
jgi:hypothetical protein